MPRHLSSDSGSGTGRGKFLLFFKPPVCGLWSRVMVAPGNTKRRCERGLPGAGPTDSRSHYSLGELLGCPPSWEEVDLLSCFPGHSQWCGLSSPASSQGRLHPG